LVLRRLREGVPLPTAVISVEWEGVVVLGDRSLIFEHLLVSVIAIREGVLHDPAYHEHYHAS
jgi:hypothetical protein